MQYLIKLFLISLFTIGIYNVKLCSQSANITIDPDTYGAKISSELHGAFFEEISHGGEGGLYAELIQNRGFEDAQLPKGTVLKEGRLIPPRNPHYNMNGKVSDWWMPWSVTSEYPAWSLISLNGSASIALTNEHPLNNATPHNLKLSIHKDDDPTSGVMNTGFWGINVEKGKSYLLKFYVWTDGKYNGDAIASLVKNSGEKIAVKSFKISSNKGWVKYEAEILAQQSDNKAAFQLSFSKSGIIYLDFVSLFPKHTFKNRPNGLRADLAEKIADLKPSFLRWPGGCYVEGISIESAPNWKETIGPVEARASTFSVWDYYTSNGFGYDEYLRFCEDIGAKAMYVFNVGMSCEMRSGTYVSHDSAAVYLQDALDAIEYAIGPVSSTWGSLRAKNGHPAPYPLAYVEVGNEQHGEYYAERYNMFYDAIYEKYPQIKIIASMGIGDVDPRTLKGMKHVQYADEHAYKGAYWSMGNYNHFDTYPRDKDWDVYVGEYATNNGVGRGNMIASLSDAVYIMGMERNSDLVKISSYAPLLVNVNDEDWPVNLINFNNETSFARISYYMLKMMNDNLPTINIKSDLHLKQPEELTKDAFKGGVGLATWDTKSAYRDIEIEQNGKVIYKSDFIANPTEWKPVRGKWRMKDNSWEQFADGPQTFSYLPGKVFSNYTLRLKAKKLSGYNGFIIPFAVKDSNTFLRLHIGAWVNAVTMIESVTNGYDVANISSPVRLPFKVEPDKWYNIAIKVMGDSLSAYIDDSLLITYKQPQRFFAIAGKDEKSNELIVKIVNAYGNSYSTQLDIKGTHQIENVADIISLSAPDGASENSFENPTQFVPVKTSIKIPDKKFTLQIPPYSFSIIKLKLK